MEPRPRLPQLLDTATQTSLAELFTGEDAEPLTVPNSDAYALALCGLADSERAARWQHLIRQMTGSQPDTAKKHHGVRNHCVVSIDGADLANFRDMESAGLVMLGADTPHSTDLTYHATPSGCDFAGLHPAAVKRATGAQPKPTRGGTLDVYA